MGTRALPPEDKFQIGNKDFFACFYGHLKIVFRQPKMQFAPIHYQRRYRYSMI